jgi:signal transduction histidine kinase
VKQTLADQPEWSSFPLIIITTSHPNPGYIWQLLTAVGSTGQAQLLERPVHTAELVSAVQSALSARGRQYQVRDELNRRLEAEEQLMEEARRKNEFLALLGHELRNPLAALNAALNIARKTPPGELIGLCENVVAKQVGQLQRLVSDLIDISRISRGKIELEPDTVDMGEQMNSAVESVKTYISEKKQQLWFSPPPEQLPIRADPVRLQQIFVNLLKNASMYTPEGGEIWFSAKSDGGSLFISCKDSGVGIPSEFLETIFEPFLEIDRYRPDREEGGLGIGLALVKQLVELHGGTVHAESGGEENGSEFIIELPVRGPAADLSAGGAAARQAAPASPPAGGTAAAGKSAPAGRTILIVEDNEDFSGLLAETLEDEGHRVQVAGSGTAALDLVRAEVPDFMIIDIGISDMDGYTIADKVRQIPGTGKAVLIALSGYNPDTEKAEKYFNHYIIKGSGIEKIFDIVSGSP